MKPPGMASRGVRPATLAVLALLLLAAAMLLKLVPSPDPNIPSTLLAVIPFLLAAWIYVENPGPGDGVGKAAGALPGLRFVHADAAKKRGAAARAAAADANALAPPPLDEGGAPLRGHAYLLVFFSTQRAVLKAAARVDAVSRRLHAAGASNWFHCMLVSRDDLEDLEAVAKHWPARSTPIAHDATQQASANYISAHRAWAQPHAFLVGSDGIISWHGQINRKALGSECARVLATGSDKSSAAARGGAAGAASTTSTISKAASAGRGDVKGLKVD